MVEVETCVADAITGDVKVITIAKPLRPLAIITVVQDQYFGIDRLSVQRVTLSLGDGLAQIGLLPGRHKPSCPRPRAGH